MNNETKAINFFTRKTNYRPEDIDKIEPLHEGYTNISFKVLTKDQRWYQVRLSRGIKLANTQNEKNVLGLIDFPYYMHYDAKTGDAIKRWISGVTPPMKLAKSNAFLKQLAGNIKTMHITKVTKPILKHDSNDCLAKAKLPKIHLAKYNALVSKYRYLPTVLSHNDLSPDNMLYLPNKKIQFIDFEWSRLNNRYWDLANYTREVELTKAQALQFAKYYGQLDGEILCDFIYICTNYAYQWTFNMPQDERILAYRAKLLTQMEHYYREFFA
ncbi:MAG: phosphotransferase [Mycoplasmataceae bacterium]|nr:phosphotransferase [Mycoplasmataceae bacterium]